MSFKWVYDILMLMLFAGESCQSQNKMTPLNLRLLFVDSVRSLFKTDDPYVLSKLNNGEPSSAGLKAGPAGSSARYKNLTHDFLRPSKMVLDPILT